MYPYNNIAIINILYQSSFFYKAIVYLNKLSFRHEQLMMTMNNGFGEILAMTISENLREKALKKLKADLKIEILT